MDWKSNSKHKVGRDFSAFCPCFSQFVTALIFFCLQNIVQAFLGYFFNFLDVLC